jgi:hypothetical protein
VYITGFSVSALEANARGKTVLITDEIGKQLFAELIETGVFEAVSTAEEIVAAVEAARPPSRDAGYYARDLALSKRAFDRIAGMHVEPLAKAGEGRGESPDEIALGPAADELFDMQGGPVIGVETVP